MEWTPDSVLLLLAEYKKHPVLFNTKLPTYHNKHLRRNALEMVAAAVSSTRPNTTVEDIKSKFKNLRTSFGTEHLKKKKSEMSGVDDIYQPTLYYYNEMLFLVPYLVTRSTMTTPEQEPKYSATNDMLETLNMATSESLTAKAKPESPSLSMTMPVARHETVTSELHTQLNCESHNTALSEPVLDVVLKPSFQEQIVASDVVECTISPLLGELVTVNSGAESESASSQDQVQSPIQTQKTVRGRKRLYASQFQGYSVPAQSQKKRFYKMVTENAPTPLSSFPESMTPNQRFSLVIADILDAIKSQDVLVDVKKELMMVALEGQAKDLKRNT